jgi:hypothetical protein
MPEETLDDLRDRVGQLEAELARTKEALAEALRRGHADPDEDVEWGEFNPG